MECIIGELSQSLLLRLAKMANVIGLEKLVDGVEIISRGSVDHVSHVWIADQANVLNLDSFVDVRESPNHKKIHADIWGKAAWDIPTRSYYDERDCVLSMHGGEVHVKLLNRIIKKFDKMGLPVLKVHCVVY